ncbi:MAG: hypothetical protein AAFQ94_12480 [Bacteroidota bacterium]
MSLQVSFRVVGLYCYFQNLQLDNVTETSTVKQVLDAIKAKESAFDYAAVDLGGKEIVDTMSYSYSDSSLKPFNATNPSNGFRDLSNHIASTSLIWQYYRSVTGSMNGSEPFEIKLLSRGQPSYAIQKLNFNDSFFGALPTGFEISTYNLTWRLVQIQMSPENQAKFMIAKANLLSSKS